MKVRKQNAKPCEKKGIDNALSSYFCEIRNICKSHGSYLFPQSRGTKTHNSKSCVNFISCHAVEEQLIEEGLVRYESKEALGLELLLEAYDRFDDDHNYEHIDTVSYTEVELAHMFQYKVDFVQEFKASNYLVTPENHPGEKIFLDNLLNHLPPLGYSASFAHEIFSSPPRDLFESFFKSLHKRKAFYQEFEKEEGETKEGNKIILEADDLTSVANCIIKGVETPEDLKVFWPRYTKTRYKHALEKIQKIVEKSLPFWAKRFDLIWNELTDVQMDAFKLEYFPETDEKPTQVENAQKLNIKVTSYKDRLTLTLKKLEKLYPEFERLPRRKKKQPHELVQNNPPAPLYEVINGLRVEIPHPLKPKDKVLSPTERELIKKWAIKRRYDTEEEFERAKKHSGDRLSKSDLDNDSLDLDEIYGDKDYSKAKFEVDILAIESEEEFEKIKKRSELI